MKTFRRWLPVALIGLAAGGLYAKNLKIRVFTPAGPGVSENPGADGMAQISFKQNPQPRSEVKVHITDFLPNTTYGVQVDPGVTDPLAITTNPAGNGHWSAEVSFDLTQFNPTIRIFRWDGNVGSIGQVSFDELRAIGCASGNCPIGEPCTTDADCDDAFLCTIDTCNSGFCFHATVTCDDGNPCTADFCRPSDGGCDNDLLPGCTP